jgi:hypothetical protein
MPCYSVFLIVQNQALGGHPQIGVGVAHIGLTTDNARQFDPTLFVVIGQRALIKVGNRRRVAPGTEDESQGAYAGQPDLGTLTPEKETDQRHKPHQGEEKGRQIQK